MIEDTQHAAALADQVSAERRFAPPPPPPAPPAPHPEPADVIDQRRRVLLGDDTPHETENTPQ